MAYISLYNKKRKNLFLICKKCVIISLIEKYCLSCINFARQGERKNNERRYSQKV